MCKVCTDNHTAERYTTDDGCAACGCSDMSLNNNCGEYNGQCQCLPGHYIEHQVRQQCVSLSFFWLGVLHVTRIDLSKFIRVHGTDLSI